MRKKVLFGTMLLLLTGFGISKQTAEASKQGTYISDGSIVQITKKNYDIWQNFSWQYKNNTSNIYQKTYQAKGRYQHENGATYYSLYDNKGTWLGYLNSNATKKTNTQGDYISDGRYVKISKENYKIWQNFSWQYKNNTSHFYNQSFQAKGRYQHFNGSTYYSLYDNKGNWYGYLNAGATQHVNAQGNYISDGSYIKVTKKNDTIWQNFEWKKRSSTNTYYGQTLQARGRYEHFNGSTYYSLFDKNGKWVGYLNADATKKNGAAIDVPDPMTPIGDLGLFTTEAKLDVHANKIMDDALWETGERFQYQKWEVKSTTGKLMGWSGALISLGTD